MKDTLPKRPMVKALHYTRKITPRTKTITIDLSLEIDNNSI